MITVIDVGATKTLIAQFDKDMRPLNISKFATPKNQDEFLQFLQQQLKNYTSTNAISIGIPGIIGQDGSVLRCGNLPWKNLQLKLTLKKAFGCPVYVHNNAKLAGLAEINSLKNIHKV